MKRKSYLSPSFSVEFFKKDIILASETDNYGEWIWGDNAGRVRYE